MFHSSPNRYIDYNCQNKIINKTSVLELKTSIELILLDHNTKFDMQKALAIS